MVPSPVLNGSSALPIIVPGRCMVLRLNPLSHSIMLRLASTGDRSDALPQLFNVNPLDHKT